MTHGLTTAGLVFVIVTWSALLIVTIFCFWKVLVSKREQWNQANSEESENDL